MHSAHGGAGRVRVHPGHTCTLRRWGQGTTQGRWGLHSSTGLHNKARVAARSPSRVADVVVKYLSREDYKEDVHRAAAVEGLTPRLLKLALLPGGMTEVGAHRSLSGS